MEGFLSIGNLQDGFGFSADDPSSITVLLRRLDEDEDIDNIHDPSSVWQVWRWLCHAVSQ